MEVFIRNVPPLFGDKDLKAFFEPVLQALDITTFACHKSGTKWAHLTFLTLHEARSFLAVYGEGSNKVSQLRISNSPMYFSESNKPADKFLLRSLETEAKKHRDGKNSVIKHRHQENVETNVISFKLSSVSCGIWAYIGTEVVFSPEFTLRRQGELTFGKRSLRVVLQSGHRIDIAYSSIQGLVFGAQSQRSLTIALFWAPKFSTGLHPVQDLEAMLESLGLSKPLKRKPRMRKPSLDSEHEKIASSCLVYRFDLTSVSNTQLSGLKLSPELPPAIYQRTRVHPPIEAFITQFQRMMTTLASVSVQGSFPILFQLQKLAQNGYLSPLSVIDLLPEALDMLLRSGSFIAAEALRKLFNDLPFRGPEARAQQFNLENLVELVRFNEIRAKAEDDYTAGSFPTSQSSNTARVFRAKVTPAGIYLYGPSPETKNRVMRKYSGYLDYFLRVEFCDEDGQQVRYDPRISNTEIFNERFKYVLRDGISIAGRAYGFLGYSHSSLRSQSCWFLAPFWHEADRELVMYSKVIADLGDFSNIRIPAKCAARIGQTFSDTPVTVPLASISVEHLEDVKRNGRVFSDGVGTFSESVLNQIWNGLSTKRLVKPTVFQIRHQGAKGVISFDSRIKRHSLFLRPSMIKFEGSPSTDIEICGAAWKPLPMYLNRQLIKIMEDLGVTEDFFLDLQAKAVEQLRASTLTDVNAASFLSSHNVGETTCLPWLIRQLVSRGLSFKNDCFLCSIVRTAVMVELRALKHRTRIFVEEGYTLYGIMDETGTLEEGEVFVTYNTPSHQQRVLIRDNIVVTRSPALHPGDVRLANAVRVPPDSPLMNLTNCIVFSQWGDRDLPSQLSGGDLDGDLYNIIFDRRVHIRNVHEPADYPRQEALDLGRFVTREDITDFFITFMETDQLGRIATLHMVKADQSDNGSFDEDCITLAELHSTAVDFSKTGIPVDLTNMPKYSRARPDFMAPGPNVTVTKRGEVNFTESADDNQDDEDFQSYVYYESFKVLGKLYRAIDEKEIFLGIESMSQAKGVSTTADGQILAADTNIIDDLFQYVKDRCRSLRWEHLLEIARDIREEYDGLLLNIMHEYAQHPVHPISETEVLVGNIVGKTGAQTKQQREMSITMKQRYDEDVSYIMNKIVREKAEPSMEALERSVACLEISTEIGRVRNKGGEQLVSFKYVAAMLSLREIERCSGGTGSTKTRSW